MAGVLPLLRQLGHTSVPAQELKALQVSRRDLQANVLRQLLLVELDAGFHEQTHNHVEAPR